MFERYSLSNLRRALAHPGHVRGELNRLGELANRAFHRRFVPKDGTLVAAADWDNLVVLDACRYDAFAERNTIDGRLESRTSLGGQSEEFLRENFGDRTCHDTVCVTANPYAAAECAGVFHDLITLFDEDGWDPDLQTVPPGTVAAAAREARETYPDKRLYVHFMQPHMPAIGEKRHDLPRKGLYPGDGDHPGADEMHAFACLRHGVGGVTVADVRAAYEENLDIALDVVADLLPDLGGRSVVTADHGELFGERLWPIPVRGYRHVPDVRVRELTEVPWLVVDEGPRRTVRADPPVAERDADEEVVANRLEALGYRS